MLIWTHFILAVLAIALGLVNLASEKGTRRHRFIGWCWLVVMTYVTVSSFWIRELNDGDFSWIHILTVWTIFCMVVTVVSIRRGRVRTHAAFMTGTMIGALIAGGFAMMPGRFISELFGYCG